MNLQEKVIDVLQSLEIRFTPEVLAVEISEHNILLLLGLAKDAFEAGQASVRCAECKGSGRVWVGEDEDRPAKCSTCGGKGV